MRQKQSSPESLGGEEVDTKAMFVALHVLAQNGKQELHAIRNATTGNVLLHGGILPGVLPGTFNRVKFSNRVEHDSRVNRNLTRKNT